MLVKLKIKNIALINESVIEFNNGLNILTGETGAGKSLVIDSLNFVLGARADKTLVKTGEDYAYVEAVFTLNNISDQINEFFNSANIEPENTVIISRYLNLNGKNEIKVNGEYVTNSMLKKLTTYLVDIHGQHSHQALLDVKNHLNILDSFNESGILRIKQKLVHEFTELREVKNKISKLGGNDEERTRNIELLKYQIEEIEKSDLQPDEDEALQNKKNMMINTEKIFTSLNLSNESLGNGDINALSLVKSTLNNLSSILKYDANLEDYHNRLQGLYYELLDVYELMNEKNKELDFSEAELETVEERLDLIKSLKNKYGKTINEVLNYLDQAHEKLNLLENSLEVLQALNKEKLNILQNIYNICVELTNVRKEIANIIKNKLIKELKDLGMKNANFETVFLNDYRLEDIEQKAGLEGADVVEFMFSANLGEPVKPLSKIISGGEMSRFMLAIKCVINENNNKTFIFDEIDNGVGGLAGTIIAQKLAKLSNNNQVICVTHLAQIASFADCHFKIIKQEVDGRTLTQINLLGDEGVEQEITRMLGSAQTSSVGLMHARELINGAHDFKKN